MRDESRILKLAQNLIATNSENPPGSEAAVAKLLRDHMESYGISCRSVGGSERPNLVFSTGEINESNLVIHGHMDTVPAGSLDKWSVPPFEAVVKDGRLHGRGACDMKGPLAALAETMIQYADGKHSTPLVMLATSDEERGCSGAEEVAKSGILRGVRYGVCAEPTGLNVLVGEKGMLWSRVVAHGKSAHGSRPEEGLNAIRLCIEALDVLTGTEYEYEEDPLLGTPTVNVSFIRGGVTINVVPDYCEALIDMRLVKGQETENILNLMRARIAKSELGDTVEIEYVHGKPAVVTPADSKIVKAAVDAVRIVRKTDTEPHAATFGTDCSVLQPKIGIVNVICGPGLIEDAHQPDESIELRQLFDSVEVYLRIAECFQ